MSPPNEPKDPNEPFSTDPSAQAVPSLKSTDLPPGTKVGEFRVEQKVGEGGMGGVYAANHPLIGKKAAVKVISLALCQNPLAVERFVQEARAANQIGHPNIVDVFSFGELPDGRSYLVMEWLPGQTLAQRLAEGVPLPEAIEILDQMTDALEAAHEKGIIHRDLKPANVILMPVRGQTVVKLLDFGLAKLAEQDDSRLQRTRTGVMMGTPEYVSPEQARGKNVDHRTDLYALGVIAYELILGRLPFDADNVADLISQHLHVAPTPPRTHWPEIPPNLEALMLGLLAKDRESRPTIADVRRVIAELVGVQGRSAQLRIGGPQSSPQLQRLGSSSPRLPGSPPTPTPGPMVIPPGAPPLHAPGRSVVSAPAGMRSAPPLSAPPLSTPPRSAPPTPPRSTPPLSAPPGVMPPHSVAPVSIAPPLAPGRSRARVWIALAVCAALGVGFAVAFTRDKGKRVVAIAAGGAGPEPSPAAVNTTPDALPSTTPIAATPDAVPAATPNVDVDADADADATPTRPRATTVKRTSPKVKKKVEPKKKTEPKAKDATSKDRDSLLQPF